MIISQDKFTTINTIYFLQSFSLKESESEMKIFKIFWETINYVLQREIFQNSFFIQQNFNYSLLKMLFWETNYYIATNNFPKFQQEIIVYHISLGNLNNKDLINAFYTPEM